jgi:excisionase family DNA binding protein
VSHADDQQRVAVPAARNDASPEGMLTVKEVAHRLCLTQWAIYRAIQRGELAAYKPCGRLRIHNHDLEAWLDSTRLLPERRATSRPARIIPPPPPDRVAREPSVGSLRARVRARRGKGPVR